jgi:hypothetical protein
MKLYLIHLSGRIYKGIPPSAMMNKSAFLFAERKQCTICTTKSLSRVIDKQKVKAKIQFFVIWDVYYLYDRTSEGRDYVRHRLNKGPIRLIFVFKFCPHGFTCVYKHVE